MTLTELKHAIDAAMVTVTSAGVNPAEVQVFVNTSSEFRCEIEGIVLDESDSGDYCAHVRFGGQREFCLDIDVVDEVKPAQPSPLQAVSPMPHTANWTDYVDGPSPRRGPCGMKYHAKDCDCGGMGGDR